MSPEDPRHGTHRGYVVGCREDCCTRAHTLYMKLYRLGRQHKLIDPTGTIRRIQGLYALGWTAKQIGEHCGRSDEWPRHIEKRSSLVSTRTALLIADAYEHMCMTLPAGPYADRCRREAAAKGWVPPLCWDNIDDPNERPRRGADHRWRKRTDIDPVAVERAVAGERLKLSHAERHAVVAQLRAGGWSLKRIEAHTGITKAERYVERQAS